MTYSEMVKVFCNIFNADEEHVEDVLQKALDRKGIKKTPQQYYEESMKKGNFE